jgi:type I restriction enzyme S subunit
MEQINFLQTFLVDFSKEKTLRFDVKFHNVFTKTIKTEETTPLLNFFEIGTKEYEGHEINEIKYVEIGSVTNEGDIIPFNLADDVGLDVTEKERLIEKIENGDIFKPQKGSLLIASVRPNLKKFVSIGNEESSFHFTKAFIYLVPKQNLIESKLLKYLLRTVLFDRLVGLCREGKGYPTLKENDLKFFFIDNDFIRKLKLNKEKILKKIDKNEKVILQLKSKIESLQNIIDDVFVKYGVKSKKITDGQGEHFPINFQKIGGNLFLRLGAQYYAFFEVHQGLLFDKNGKYKQVPLRRLIKPYNAQILKKGILDKSYILIDLEQLETKTGKIIDETNEVEEIGSDKVLFGDAEIIISKIDPYLAYVFINDKSKNYIGTTELVPFKLISKDVNINYLKYCLLSNEYITKSALIMYGKRHPRLHIRDLLAIKIPLPDLEIQQKIVSEIQQREEKSNQYKEQIKKLREEINELIYKTLNPKINQ